MTRDTLIKIIKGVITEKGVNISSSKDSKLSALGREYDGKDMNETTVSEIVTKLKDIFSDAYELDRHTWAEIQKKLTRY